MKALNVIPRNELSIKMIQDAVAYAKKHKIKPLFVKTQRQARSMSKKDPLGYKWKVGEEYLLLETFSAGSRRANENSRP